MEGRGWAIIKKNLEKKYITFIKRSKCKPCKIYMEQTQNFLHNNHAGIFLFVPCIFPCRIDIKPQLLNYLINSF